MDKKKIGLILLSVMCIAGNAFAAESSGSVRSALSRTGNPYSPYYGKAAVVADRMDSVKVSRPDKAAAVKKVSDKKIRESKPFAGAESLSPVQRKILADKGKYSEPENPTGYYLDGEKIAYPDKTRIIKHVQGKPVKIFMQAKRITDIYMNSDEHIESITTDNPFGLRIDKTYESGRYSRWHVSVTPVDNNPGTEMYIRTDKRSYHFYLEPSANGEGYCQFVRFAYLEDRSGKTPVMKKVAPQKVEKPNVGKPVVKRVVKKAPLPPAPKPAVKAVGKGVRTASGASRGIELYWSN